MTVDLKVYDNGDHTCLVWLPSDLKPIRIAAGSPSAVSTMAPLPSTSMASVGFADGDKPTMPRAGGSRFSASSGGTTP